MDITAALLGNLEADPVKVIQNALAPDAPRKFHRNLESKLLEAQLSNVRITSMSAAQWIQLSWRLRTQRGTLPPNPSMGQQSETLVLAELAVQNLETRH
jgi:hypothetical protein